MFWHGDVPCLQVAANHVIGGEIHELMPQTCQTNAMALVRVHQQPQQAMRQWLRLLISPHTCDVMLHQLPACRSGAANDWFAVGPGLHVHDPEGFKG